MDLFTERPKQAPKKESTERVFFKRFEQPQQRETAEPRVYIVREKPQP